MKYELQALEKIISIDLKPGNLNKQKNKAAFIKKCSAMISIEVEKINKAIIHEVFNCENDKRIANYFHQHQHGIVKLMDMLQSYLLKEQVGNIYQFPALRSLIDNYKNILQEINQLLVFLQNNFAQYFDEAYKIPDFKRFSIIPGIKQILKQSTTLLENNKIDNGLVEIMVMPFKYFLKSENLINRCDFNYLTIYKKEVVALLAENKISASEICELLIRLNFNDPTFTFYYIDKIKDANKINNLTARIEFYYLQLKIINQIQKKPGIAYDPSLPSIHDQLGTWLAEEINFLEKKQQLEYSFPVTMKDRNAKTEKVQTTLSVPQLSLAVKLLLDSGVIKTRHTRDVMRMISQSFRTGNIEQISEVSLRNKIYNIEPAAIEGMKKVIMDLWDNVRKY